MKKHILSQEYYNDPVTIRLVEFLEQELIDLEEATLFYRYPMIRELDEELRYPSVLLITPIHGILLFKCDGVTKQRHHEVDLLGEELLRIEDLLFSKLIKSPNKKLKKGRRNLSFNLSSALYLPNFEEDDIVSTDVELLTTNNEVRIFLQECKDEEIDEKIFKEIFSIIESSTAIIKPKERNIQEGKDNSKAALLKMLEEEIATFDEAQKYAALSQLEGPQRIRGLAGTGKTIILCMKAAILHLKYPDKKILYTFMTKSLYDYIELLITRFYKVLGDGHPPNLIDKINIMHAWGGDNLKGVYYNSCKMNAVEPIPFRKAVRAAGSSNAFDYICKDLLRQTNGSLKKEYDYVLMDEAQDFKPSFYQVCRAIVKKDCLVWGYDDLQNIFDVTIQNTIETFQNEYGAEGIDLNELQKSYPDMDNDIVLSKCYRNPKEILVTAHALGFGINNDTLIQSLENNSHWEDLGYKVLEGNSKNGDHMVIERLPKNSPLSISEYQGPDDIIELYSAKDFNDEVNWVCNTVQFSIEEDGLRPDDIIVISLDDRNMKSYFENISSELLSRKIFTHNLSTNTYQKGFSEDNCVTLSSVYKAKGHEAAMVIVIGCDVFENKKYDRSMRNKIFTAFTRAKAWLKVSGMNIEDDSIYREINKIKEDQFILDFIYKEAHIIQRDLTEEHAKKSTLRDLVFEMVDELKKKGYSEQEIKEMVKERQIEDDKE
ncbi:DEAD/DEAH box helicase [Bacillus marinisedimentorum]|uniref:DEAD/DEAH box helicase n=1 Tax=Bacillus marinisedimentorum TaxID=1821260 RepID=UPI0008724854|nr:ATP-binding domain-containing protein [Bacillus marinisedimentorum]